MRRLLGGVVVAVMAVAAAGLEVGGAHAAAGLSPLERHVLDYPGGPSAGVRNFVLRSHGLHGILSARSGPSQSRDGTRTPTRTQFGPNLQINSDPLNTPQTETAVALDLTNPMVAVAAAQDGFSGTAVLMRTSDGGRTWKTTTLEAEFEGATCSCCDSSMAYSLRDRAFYLGYLCIGPSDVSEVHLFKSVDGGATWTPPNRRALVVSNHDYDNGTTDTSIINDKDIVVVDNSPTSPHFGRIYVTYIKFHFLPNGFGDYCPTQLAYTDLVPTPNPSLATFTHTAVVPDRPGDDGVGPTANQHAHPVVEADGDVDVSYSSEDCNTGLDRALLFKKSTDGGETFPPMPTRIDKPGQFEDNPDLDDILPPTSFRAGLSPSLTVSKRTGTLAYVYQNNVNRPQSEADISLQRSTDGGATWSDAQFLSVTETGQPADKDQFFPWIDADEDGNLFAIWYDRRLDPQNRLVNTWQAVSLDDGVTWRSRRITTQAWDSLLFDFIGDYVGLAASNAAIYPVWTDGRDLTFKGETDIFTNVEIRP